MPRSFSRSSLAILLTFWLLTQAAFAMTPSSSADQLKIVTVEVNTSTNQIKIKGENFGTSAPTVTLTETSLNLVSSSNTEIVAELPAGIRPGTYQFEVSRDGGATEDGKDTSTVIIPQ